MRPGLVEGKDKTVQLTQEQLRAAKEGGIEFQPATPEQVARLTMQRRIFLLPDGQPHVGSRNGTVWETHGAIALLIDGEAKGQPAAVVETLQEAAAADVETAVAMAAEQGSARGAQVIKRGPGRPRGAWGAAKRRTS